MRPLWFLGGAVAMALGGAGVILPLVPTVPFVLLAAFCFARSSDSAHSWLINHRKFGPAILDWRDRGAISQRAKVVASVCMAAALVLSLLLGVPGWVLSIQTVVLLAVAVFIWSRPAA